MNKLTVKIPDVLKHYYGCEDFFKAIPYDRIEPGIDLIFDMSQVSFVSPYGLLLLMLMGRSLHNESEVQIQLTGMHEDVYKYLERMDFFKYTEEFFRYDEYFRTYSTFSRSFESHKLIEIKPITITTGSKDVISFVNEFRRRANSILGFWLDYMDADVFVPVISEICQNTYEHSESTGYVALQTYEHPNENAAILAVCDLGIGIQASLANLFPDLSLDTTTDYIQNALYEMRSLRNRYKPTERNHFGLSMVRQIVQERNGYLFVRSFDGSYLISPRYPSGRGNFSCSSFPGTQIWRPLQTGSSKIKDLWLFLIKKSAIAKPLFVMLCHDKWAET